LFDVYKVDDTLSLQPQIIHSPQLLNSLMGKSEEVVLLLFEEAIEDQKNAND
jgi:hypothetical protein